MLILGAILISVFGYTNFVSIPKETQEQVKERIPEETRRALDAWLKENAEDLTLDELSRRAQALRDAESQAKQIVEDLASQKVGALNSWTDSALGGGWTNYGGNYAPVGYTTDGKGIVYLRGLAKGGDSSVENTIFNLPIHLRPEHMMEIVVACAGAIPCEAIIQTDGRVWFETSDSRWISFDGISFPSADAASR